MASLRSCGASMFLRNGRHQDSRWRRDAIPRPITQIWYDISPHVHDWPEIRSFEQQAFALARLSLQLACCNRSITDKYSASFNPQWGVHRFGPPVARAFRTFDCEIPNWRAILAGVTPALKAARTTFICPRVSVVSAMSTRRRWKRSFFVGDRFGDPCAESTPTFGCGLSRRLISSSVATWSKSNSSSFKCLTALRRFFGKTCRCGSGSAFASAVDGLVGSDEVSRPASVEKRSGEVWLLRSRPIAKVWRSKRVISTPSATLDAGEQRQSFVKT
jgi:hypothetical protein